MPEPLSVARYWYHTQVRWCPACGWESSNKKRVTDRPRPDAYWARHEVIEEYNYCD